MQPCGGLPGAPPACLRYRQLSFQCAELNLFEDRKPPDSIFTAQFGKSDRVSYCGLRNTEDEAGFTVLLRNAGVTFRVRDRSLHWAGRCHGVRPIGPRDVSCCNAPTAGPQVGPVTSEVFPVSHGKGPLAILNDDGGGPYERVRFCDPLWVNPSGRGQ
jgi:hypothetical protein